MQHQTQTMSMCKFCTYWRRIRIVFAYYMQTKNIAQFSIILPKTQWNCRKSELKPLKHSSFYLLFITFASLNSKTENIMAKDINRLKVALAEKKKTNKWLAEQLGKDPATVSKWCTNASQPSIETLLEIARVLQVDVKDLLQSTAQIKWPADCELTRSQSYLE